MWYFGKSSTIAYACFSTLVFASPPKSNVVMKVIFYHSSSHSNCFPKFNSPKTSIHTLKGLLLGPITTLWRTCLSGVILTWLRKLSLLHSAWLSRLRFYTVDERVCESNCRIGLRIVSVTTLRLQTQEQVVAK